MYDLVMRGLRFAICGFLMMFCSTGLALADSPASLTLEQALVTAFANNPQVKSAQARLGVTQAEILTAGARLNPLLLSDNGFIEKTYRIGLEQTLQIGGKRHRRIELAQAQRDVVLAEIKTTLLDLRTSVRRTYAQLYYTQERQQVNQDLLNSNERLLEIAKKRKEAGDIAGLDVLQTQILAINTKNDTQMVAYQVIEARNNLNNLLFQPLPPSTVLAPPNTFPALKPFSQPSTPSGAQSLQGTVTQMEINPEGLIEQAFANRPELQQNLHNLTVTQRQLALAKANRVPDLILGAGSGAISNNPGKYDINAYFTASMELPVLNRQQGPMLEAMARRLQLEQEQQTLKNRIALEVTNAYNAFRMNQERIALYETELLPVAQAVSDKSQQSFAEGKSPILVPIQAQQAYMNTRLGYLQALVDSQNAISDLERAVGIGL